MKFLRVISLLVFSSFLFSQSNLALAKEFVLANVSPEIYDFKLYHSKAKKTILVSLIIKSKNEFACQPNRYVFYNYKEDRFTEIFGANLKTTSQFNKSFYSEIRTLRAYKKGEAEDWKNQVNALLAEFNVSSSTLEQSKVSNASKSLSCWQQAALVNMKSDKRKTFPLILANICRNSFCSDFFWKNQQEVKAWIHVAPNRYHLAEINTVAGTYEILKDDDLYYKKWHEQENAPGKNLITAENVKAGAINLLKEKGKKIAFQWSQKDNLLSLKLIRNFASIKKATNIKYQASQFVKKEKFTKALRTIEFGEWLGLSPLEKVVVHMKIFNQGNNFIGVLNLVEEQKPQNKQLLCQILHSDKDFKPLWKNPAFDNKFSKVCF